MLLGVLERHLTWWSSNWSPPKAATQGLMPPVPRAMSSSPTMDRALWAQRSTDTLSAYLRVFTCCVSVTRTRACVQLTCVKSCHRGCHPCCDLLCHGWHLLPWWSVPACKPGTGKRSSCAEGGGGGGGRREELNGCAWGSDRDKIDKGQKSKDES